MIYENQDEVGRALKKVIPSVVKREELFITSKLWNHSHRPDRVEKELDETLKQLGIDYLDLYCTSSSSLSNPELSLTSPQSDPLACCIRARRQILPSSLLHRG